MHSSYIVAWCVLGLVTTTGSQFMKGSSPVVPSNILETCQQQAVAKRYNVNRDGQHSDVVNKWCSTYGSVVPCIERSVPATNNVNDWFLSLVFNESVANDLSRAMCRRFPSMSNLTCVDNHLVDVATCMKWTTTSAIKHFNELHNPDMRSISAEIQLKAFIYACVISDTTAKCFHDKLTSCSPQQRDLLYDYYIMLGGQCLEIISRPTHQIPQTTDKARVAARKPNPNVDTRPSPLDPTSPPTSQAEETTTDPPAAAVGVERPRDPNTISGNSGSRGNTRGSFSNWNNNNRKEPTVSERTGNSKNAASMNSHSRIYMSLLISLYAALKLV